ncbi:MAG TPA: DUF5985 family protein [Casimicrobiaceae bacterium]
MAAVVYILCAVTSVLCAILLARGYLVSRTRLLMWSAGCFALLGVNNILLVADRVIWKGTDLALARGVAGLAALVVLVLGLVWDTE